MEKHQRKPKPCKGCGLEKDVVTERCHFCSKCSESPLNRPLLLNSVCRNGHKLWEVGIKIISGRWRCVACENSRAARKWADPEKRERTRISTRKSQLQKDYGLTEDDWMELYEK